METEETTNLMDSSPITEPETPTSAETENTEGEPGEKEAAAATEGESPEAKAETTEEKKEEGEATPFHEHPRWKERDRELRTLRKELEMLRAEREQATKEAPASRNFDAERKSLKAKLDSGDIEVEDYDAEVAKLFREQMDSEMDAKLQEKLSAFDQKEQEQQIKQMRDAYLRENKEVATILQERRGEIEDLMEESPLHDAFSAAQELHLRDLKASFDKEKEAAVKEAVAAKEKEMLANFRAKTNARGLGGGPPVGESDPDAVLKDTSKVGGPVNAIAERLRQARRVA